MTNQKFSLGDKVYHKSDSSIVWVIERIEKDEAYCSTLNGETKELKKERFSLVSLEKIDDKGSDRIIFGDSPNRHRW